MPVLVTMGKWCWTISIHNIIRIMSCFVLFKQECIATLTTSLVFFALPCIDRLHHGDFGKIEQCMNVCISTLAIVITIQLKRKLHNENGQSPSWRRDKIIRVIFCQAVETGACIQSKWNLILSTSVLASVYKVRRTLSCLERSCYPGSQA